MVCVLWIQKYGSVGWSINLEHFSFLPLSSNLTLKLGLLKVSSVNTKTYGLYSFSRLSIQQWNRLQRSFPNTNLVEISSSNLKQISRKFYLENYIWTLTLGFYVCNSNVFFFFIFFSNCFIIFNLIVPVPCIYLFFNFFVGWPHLV